MEITSIPMARGFVYLAAVVDWFSRKVLSWRVSINLAVDFCLEAVEAALAQYGKPEIFNPGQGSQFTSVAFTTLLRDNAIAISRDGKGAWRDNVFVERIWRSVKYEEVDLRADDSVAEAKASIGLTWRFTTASARIRALMRERRIAPTSTTCHKSQQQHEFRRRRRVSLQSGCTLSA